MNRWNRWLNGEMTVPFRTDWKDSGQQPKSRKRVRLDDRRQLNRFLRVYTAVALVLSLVLAAILIVQGTALPDFAAPGNPTDNEVVRRYVGAAEEETGAENVIAGMILNYRGFDTFGESCVLFLAVCSVMLLLWSAGDEKTAEPSAEREAPRDAILSNACRFILPCVLIFGLCILFNGHISPGGGFSGGSVLGAAVILFAVAFGAEEVRRFFTGRGFNLVRITGLMLYAVMFGIYIYQGANGIESELAHYLVMIIDVAVGLVVMSTMYGFYSFYTKGDL